MWDRVGSLSLNDTFAAQNNDRTHDHAEGDVRKQGGRKRRSPGGHFVRSPMLRRFVTDHASWYTTDLVALASAAEQSNTASTEINDDPVVS